MSESEKSPINTPDFYIRLCEHAPIAMLATNVNFNVVLCNVMAGKLLGLEPQQIIGKSIYQAVPENRHRLLGRLLERTVSSGNTSELEIHLTADEGNGRDLSIILSPIPSDGRVANGVTAWIIDETSRRKLTERLLQAEKMASLGTLAGGVAHHFNNILGGVATFVDYALTTGDQVAMKRALQMTTEATARAAKITQALLSFAERDVSRRDLADLTEVVLTFAHLIERPIKEQHIDLQLELHPVPIVEVEANRMHQILGNLLTNAEEAMPHGGQLRICIDREENNVRLTFADTGGGIAPEHLPLVFEPFFTTKGLHAGGDKVNPGLGLSVVHGFVVEMGGTIRAESKVGEGAKFIITFPVKS